MLTVTKKFTFEAAHHLEDYKGACANLHGHSYKLFVTISRPAMQIGDDFVTDFKDLKRIVNKYIIEPWDHKDLNALMSVNPTAENMVFYIKYLLVDNLPKGIRLERIRLYETEDSCAEWWRD